MKYLGFPLIGDYLYNPDMENIGRQALHSHKLAFPHPITGKIYEEVREIRQDVSYIDRDSKNFRKGITVTTFYMAKGLEFDQVFVAGGEGGKPLF